MNVVEFCTMPLYHDVKGVLTDLCLSDFFPVQGE